METSGVHRYEAPGDARGRAGTSAPEHYPFWSKGRIGSLKSLELFADTGKTTVNVTDPNVAGAPDQLTKLKPYGDLRGGKLENVGLPAPTGTFSLAFDDNSMDELWLAAAWGA